MRAASRPSPGRRGRRRWLSSGSARCRPARRSASPAARSGHAGRSYVPPRWANGTVARGAGRKPPRGTARSAARRQARRVLRGHSASASGSRRHQYRRTAPAHPHGLPVPALAARLVTRPDHIRLAAARHPAPQLPAGTPALSPPETGTTGTEQLRDLTSQGYGPRKIARVTGCSERTVRQLLTSTRLRHPVALPADIDPHCSASSTRTASAASRTSPPRPARSSPSPPQPARSASASSTASAALTHKPPSADPARSPRTSGPLHPPRRRAAHPKTPDPPRPAQPPARSPPARHQIRHPHQPVPPARGRRRHRPAVHRARRATNADRLRRAIHLRRPPGHGITRAVAQPGRQTVNSQRPGRLSTHYIL